MRRAVRALREWPPCDEIARIGHPRYLFQFMYGPPALISESILQGLKPKIVVGMRDPRLKPWAT